MPRRNKTQKFPRRETPDLSTCQRKKRFGSELEAKKAAETQNLANPSLNLTVYKCYYCGGWHLSSVKSQIFK